MRVIGLTGGIGSGKSSVSRLLRAEGAWVIDADEIAHHLQTRGGAIWRQIVDTFGWWVLEPNGQLNRRKLGYRIFGNEKERQQLNALVHPAVHREMFRRLDEAKVQGCQVAILDVPLLIEGGLYRKVDEVWVVYATPEQQVSRIRSRDHLSPEAATTRIRAQMPLHEKLAYADRVIDNTGSLDELEKAVHQLWHEVVQGDG
ncbi:MAG: dephospho-CoA kinase [Firmicutes bacterium]|nr:dephospho-CoA kinase [Bacillota bacterium]